MKFSHEQRLHSYTSGQHYSIYTLSIALSRSAADICWDIIFLFVILRSTVLSGVFTDKRHHVRDAICYTLNFRRRSHFCINPQNWNFLFWLHRIYTGWSAIDSRLAWSACKWRVNRKTGFFFIRIRLYIFRWTSVSLIWADKSQTCYITLKAMTRRKGYNKRLNMYTHTKVKRGGGGVWGHVTHDKNFLLWFRETCFFGCCCKVVHPHWERRMISLLSIRIGWLSV